MLFFYIPIFSYTQNFTNFVTFLPQIVQFSYNQMETHSNIQNPQNDIQNKQLRGIPQNNNQSTRELFRSNSLSQEQLSLKKQENFNIQMNQQKKISKIQKIKKTKSKNEDEYRPFQKRKKNESFLRENQNRNIIPNEVNQIFSYIQKSSKSKLVLSRIFNKYPPADQLFSLRRFYLYQSLLKEKISNYINQSSLSLVTELYEPRCEIYSYEEQKYYNKVCRILIYHFLREDSVFNILTSRRMHKEKKKIHLQMRRVLKQKALQILRS